MMSANELLFRIVEDTSYVYSDGKAAKWTPEKVRNRCQTYIDRLVQDRDAFVLRNQGLLLKSLQEDGLEEAETLHRLIGHDRTLREGAASERTPSRFRGEICETVRDTWSLVKSRKANRG